MKLLMISLWVLFNCAYSVDQDSEKPQIKRKRLIDNYGTEKVKDQDCTLTKGQICKVCFAPESAAKYIISANNPNERLRTCIKCFINSKLPHIEERILISRPEDEFVVGKILKINENNKYHIQFLDGPNAGNYDTIDENGFIKLVHEIIPNEKLCPICNYFLFQEQTCQRNNCGIGICYSCYTKVPKCEFCKLLYCGTPVVVKQKNLRVLTDIILLQDFGETFTEVYGLIVNSLLVGTTITYEVKLSDDYKWGRDANGQMQISLNTDKPMTTYLFENEVEVLKPPNTYEENNENDAEFEFDLTQFYNDELDAMEEGEITNDEDPWSSLDHIEDELLQYFSNLNEVD